MESAEMEIRGIVTIPWILTLDLYPSYNPQPFHYFKLILQIYAWRWVNVWRWLEILTVCWESASSKSVFNAESIGKDADNVSTDNPKNEFDAWDDNS